MGSESVAAPASRVKTGFGVGNDRTGTRNRQWNSGSWRQVELVSVPRDGNQKERSCNHRPRVGSEGGWATGGTVTAGRMAGFWCNSVVFDLPDGEFSISVWVRWREFEEHSDSDSVLLRDANAIVTATKPGFAVCVWIDRVVSSLPSWTGR